MYNSDFSVDLESILDTIGPETSAVLLTSPSNPLTTEISETSLIQILEKARDFNTLVVVDEVYAQFTDHNFAELVRNYNNLVLIRSLSKFHGLASIRLGYLCSSKENIEMFTKVRGPWDISGHAVELAERVIKSQAWVNYLDDMARNRDVLSDHLARIGATVVPSSINFILFSHPRASELVDWLESKNIIVALLTNYPDNGNLLIDHIRIAVPNDSQIDIIKQAMKEFVHG